MVNDHSKIDQTKVLMTLGSLLKVKSIAECSTLSILQYFWSALSYNWSWKPIFGLFESGCFSQVLLYLMTMDMRQMPKFHKLAQIVLKKPI